jgi:hypothetical protein
MVVRLLAREGRSIHRANVSVYAYCFDRRVWGRIVAHSVRDLVLCVMLESLDKLAAEAAR